MLYIKILAEVIQTIYFPKADKKFFYIKIKIIYQTKLKKFYQYPKTQYPHKMVKLQENETK